LLRGSVTPYSKRLASIKPTGQDFSFR
jgi:hypothetical protein